MRLRLLALLLITACASGSVPPVRSVWQQVRSSSNPRITIEVDPSLAYLGHVHQRAMNGRTEAEEYIFSELDHGSLNRTFIVHFEHVEAGATLLFRYPRMEMVRLGRHEYLHQSFPEKDWDLFTDAGMKALLANRGLTVPSTWLVSRWVRATDRALKSEIILFYLEPAGDLPAPIDDLRLAGRSRELWKPIDREITVRGREVFHLRD